MGRIVAYKNLDSLKGRNISSLKDGPYLRFITCDDNSVFHFWDQEMTHLYQEEALKGSGFFPQSINADASSFSGTVILTVGGFFPDGNQATAITISTDYKISPPIWFEGEHLGLEAPTAEEAQMLGSDEHSHSLSLEELRETYDNYGDDDLDSLEEEE